jgi:hypothetical protein
MKHYIYIVVILIIYIFTLCEAGAQWCQAKGNLCYFKGVGPTYTCGNDCGFKNYDSDASHWISDVGQNDCMMNCCSKAGRDYCMNN